jgi:hypothetical protein
MRVLGAVIQPYMRAMLNRRHDLAPGGSIGAEVIRDHPSRWAALPLQQTLQQAFGRLGVAPRLDDLVENVSTLIDGTPQPMLLTGSADHDLVQVPDVTRAWRLAPETAGVRWSELHRPAPHSLIRFDNTTLEQHFFDQAHAQWEAEVQPDSMSDDLRWKAVALVADSRQDHAAGPTIGYPDAKLP